MTLTHSHAHSLTRSLTHSLSLSPSLPPFSLSLRYNTVDISVAVSTDGGLITPIVTNADIKVSHWVESYCTGVLALPVTLSVGQLDTLYLFSSGIESHQ